MNVIEQMLMMNCVDRSRRQGLSNSGTPRLTRKGANVGLAYGLYKLGDRVSHAPCECHFQCCEMLSLDLNMHCNRGEFPQAAPWRPPR